MKRRSDDSREAFFEKNLTSVSSERGNNYSTAPLSLGHGGDNDESCAFRRGIARLRLEG